MKENTVNELISNPKVVAIYSELMKKQGVKLSKKEEKQVLGVIIGLVEEGFNEVQIMNVIHPDMGSASLPMVPVDEPISSDFLLQVAAVPILVAISKNLPICQETVEFNSLTYSKLHLAYLFNIVDTWRYMTDQIRAEGKDHKGVQDMKQALLQKLNVGEDEDTGEPQDFGFTWNNVDVALLSFLGLSAFPESIPVYSSGYLGGTIVSQYPELEMTTTAGITQAVIIEEFLEHYIKLMMQLSLGGKDQIFGDISYESPFRNDASLWAYNVPVTDDVESFTNKYTNVRFYRRIHPSSEWLALSPAVEEANVENVNVRTRFTGYSGLCHYASRLMRGVYGRESVIVDPGFLSIDQLADYFIKALIVADIDLFELPINDEIDQDPTSPLLFMTRKALGNYFFGFVNKIYAESSAIFAYSEPAGKIVYAGMEYLPNPNFSNILIPGDLIEILELLGPIEDFKSYTGRARINKIPMLFGSIDNPFLIAPDDDMEARFSSLFFESELKYSFKAGDTDESTIPIDDVAVLCYTRGSFCQSIWYSLEGNIAQYANTRIFGSFENFNVELNYWDKYTVCFNDNVDGPIVTNYDRHFLIYERSTISVGERNMTRQMPGQIINLGLENLSAKDKLGRVRTFQTMIGYAGSEYVDSTHNPLIEVPNTLFDINTQSTHFWRRFKYQNAAIMGEYALIAIYVRGMNGNFFIMLKKIGKGIVKAVGPIAAKLIDKFTGMEGSGRAVVNVVDKLLSHKKRYKHPTKVSFALRIPCPVIVERYNDVSKTRRLKLTEEDL